MNINKWLSILLSLISLFFINTTVLAQIFTDDNTFGISGVVNTEFYYNSYDAPMDELYRSQILDDNKILASGTNLVVKFNENGSIDSSFADNGKYYLPAYYTLGGIRVIDNFIFIYGTKHNSEIGIDTFLIKLDTSGNIVSEFGENGVLVYGLDENERFDAIEFTNDGKLLVFGIKYTHPWSKFFVVRLNQDGSIDSTFQNQSYREIYVFPVKTYSIEYVRKVNNEFMIFCNGYDNDTPGLGVFKLDSDGNDVGDYNYYQMSVSPIKTFNDKLYFTEQNTGYYNSSTPHIYLFDTESLTMETILTINWSSRPSDFYINENEDIITLSRFETYSTPENDNVKIKKYLYDSENNLYIPSWDYEFNLSSINNYSTHDIVSNFHFYDDKMLVAGNSQVPQSGIFGMKFTMRRFIYDALNSSSHKNISSALFPNPANDFFTVETSGFLFPLDVLIYNSTGQLVKHEKIIEYSKERTININDFTSGIYFVKLKDHDNVENVVKLLKI